MKPASLKSIFLAILSSAALLSSCSSSGTPAQYRARFDTSQGAFVIEVKREWAPIGADRFYQLVKSGFYDEARFFRVAPGFVIQWGIARDPILNSQWKDKIIPDDPVKEANMAGYVSFASRGPNTRTTQIFLNLANNLQLDSMGFAAFGRVTEGLDVFSRIYAGYSAQPPDQALIEQQGNAYLGQNFPKLDYIKTARIE
ncbi:MAG TPA: peptidylprolyl isomerase [Bryobacteraceae bacterium]|nr:peptidylprolyl isomerase [Bryobacteraceae bacterium]